MPWTDAFSSTLTSTLAGGGLTLLGGWLGGRWQASGQKESARREDLRILIGDLLVSTDQLWRAVDGVAMAVSAGAVSMQDPVQFARLREDTGNRQVSMMSSERALSILDVVSPDLMPTGRALVDVCNSPVGLPKRAQWIAEKDDARAAFVAQARKVLS